MAETWQFDATCPNCGGPLALIAGGRSDGYRTQAIVGCTDCGRPHVITVTLAHAPELGNNAAHPAGCGCPRCVNARKTHCVHGHELTADNIYLRADGRGRECLTCRRTRRARHWKENAA